MIISVMIVPRLNVNWKLSCCKEIVEGKLRAGTRQFMKYKPFRQDLPGFSVHAHTQDTLTHTECKVIVLCALEGNNSCELKVHVNCCNFNSV
jgi:hypothetical protein